MGEKKKKEKRKEKRKLNFFYIKECNFDKINVYSYTNKPRMCLNSTLIQSQKIWCTHKKRIKIVFLFNEDHEEEIESIEYFGTKKTKEEK
jgi:hypothetical protein